MLNGIDSYLQTERHRLERVVARLEDECRARPRGSMVLKRRGKWHYAYVVRREEGKVVTRYIGRSDSWQAHAVDAKLSERKRYEEELVRAREELARVQKMLKAGGINV